MKRFLLLTVLILAVCSTVSAAQTYTYVDLVNRLTDLEGLAVLPQPGETCEQTFCLCGFLYSKEGSPGCLVAAAEGSKFFEVSLHVEALANDEQALWAT